MEHRRAPIKSVQFSQFSHFSLAHVNYHATFGASKEISGGGTSPSTAAVNGGRLWHSQVSRSAVRQSQQLCSSGRRRTVAGAGWVTTLAMAGPVRQHSVTEASDVATERWWRQRDVSSCPDRVPVHCHIWCRCAVAELAWHKCTCGVRMKVAPLSHDGVRLLARVHSQMACCASESFARDWGGAEAVSPSGSRSGALLI